MKSGQRVDHALGRISVLKAPQDSAIPCVAGPKGPFAENKETLVSPEDDVRQ